MNSLLLSNPAFTAVQDSSTDIATRLSVFAPRLILAAIVLIVGWLVALLIGNIIATIVQSVGFDALSRRLGLTRLMDNVGIEKSTSAMLGQAVTWILMIIVFMAAAEAMGIESVQHFLNSLLGYVPHVIGAMAALLIGLVLAHFLSDTVRHAAQAGGVGHSSLLATVAKNSIVAFTVLAVLIELGIAKDVMRVLLYGLVAMVTVAGGIAFGLGGQGSAKRTVESLESELKTKTKKL